MIDGRLLDQLVEEIAGAVAARLELPAVEAVEPERWRLLSVAEVAEMLGRSSRWVHASIGERGLPFVRLDGGGRMFDPDDVRAWVKARRVPAEGS